MNNLQIAHRCTYKRWHRTWGFLKEWNLLLLSNSILSVGLSPPHCSTNSHQRVTKIAVIQGTRLPLCSICVLYPSGCFWLDRAHTGSEEHLWESVVEHRVPMTLGPVLLSSCREVHFSPKGTQLTRGRWREYWATEWKDFRSQHRHLPLWFWSPSPNMLKSHSALHCKHLGRKDHQAYVPSQVLSCEHCQGQCMDLGTRNSNQVKSVQQSLTMWCWLYLLQEEENRL